MKDSKIVLLLALIMTLVAMTISGLSIVLLYKTALQEERGRLTQIAQSQARLIESIARFDSTYPHEYPGGITESTLNQVSDSRRSYIGFGKTGEFLLARREGDFIVFLLGYRHSATGIPQSIPYHSQFAAPMRLALSGQSGTIIGLDYRGEEVVAAYEPIAGLDWGIVAKIDLAEHRAPFIRASLIAAGIGLLVIFLGVVCFIRATNPLILQLRESEEHFRGIFEDSGIAMVLIDAKNRYIQTNRAMIQLFGYTEDELLAMSASDLTGATDPASSDDPVRQIWAGQVDVFSMEKRILNKDGVAVWVNATVAPIRNASGDIQYALEQLQDITDRKKAEESLREHEQYITNLMDTVGDAIFTIKMPERRIEYVNKRIGEIFGYFPDEVIGQTTQMLYKEEADYEAFGQELQAALKKKQNQVHSEQKLKKKNGEEIWAEITTTFMFSDEQLTRVISLIKDISERKKMEEELRKSQNLESLGVLAGGIAHDFNNVLTGVIGGLSLLEMMLDKNSGEYEIAKESRRAADRTRGLTQQLLTFAKGGAPIKEAASVQTLIREVTTLSLSGSKVKPEYHFAENLHSVHIDQGQIAQVIQNLVINADQAMPEGGTLKIVAENSEVSARDTLPLAAANYVKISVIDQGIGMSDAVMAKIFDPYYTTKPAGHGLGLSISYSIVQRHEGYLAVHSEVNRGSTFVLYLPALQKKAITATSGRHSAPTGSGKILLMDDEELIHKTLGKALALFGYQVHSAYNGEEALASYQAATAQPFDVVIMDLTIPGGSGGKETVKKLHAIDPQARVLVASGYAHDPVMANYAEYGFVGAINKPVDIHKLAETIKSVLENGRNRVDNSHQ